MFRKRFEYVSPPLSPCEQRTLCHCERKIGDPYSLAYEVLYVIARSIATWQSPGRVTILCTVCAVRKGILVIALFLTK